MGGKEEDMAGKSVEKKGDREVGGGKDQANDRHSCSFVCSPIAFCNANDVAKPSVTDPACFSARSQTLQKPSFWHTYVARDDALLSGTLGLSWRVVAGRGEASAAGLGSVAPRRPASCGSFDAVSPLRASRLAAGISTPRPGTPR